MSIRKHIKNCAKTAFDFGWPACRKMYFRNKFEAEKHIHTVLSLFLFPDLLKHDILQTKRKLYEF